MPEAFRERPRERGVPGQDRRSYDARGVEGIIDRANNRLDAMLTADPDLGRFVPPGSRSRAGGVLQRVPDLLRSNPGLVEDLRAVSRGDGTGVTTMLVLPEYPLVLADTGGSITALAPVLSCTANAIRTEFSRVHPGTYDTFFSDGGLEDAVWEQFERRPGSTFDFDPKTMKPADYVALAVKAFENEPFRIRFAKGDSSFTPLV